MAVWSFLCISVLLFGYFQRDIHDMPVAFYWLIIIFTAPVGIVVGPVTGIATTYFSNLFGIPYSPFFSLVPSWLILVVSGYLQWFVAVPKLIKWCRSKWSGT